MVQRIHFIAICGTGMAALAGMLKERGFQITGSDENVYPPMSTFLESKGIYPYPKFDADHLDPAPDLVIIGNAMSRGNPEVEYALNQRLRYASLPEILKEYFIRGKYSCVVAGTHGKTTISGLLAWTLESAGLDPSFFIGGIPENFGQGYKLGEGHLFVLEGDEYDSAFFDKGPKFLHYMPDLVILNNVEFDHADIYRSFDEVRIAFQRLINLIPANGHLVACGDDVEVRKLADRAFCTVTTFGTGPEAEWRATDIRAVHAGTEFTVVHNNKPLGPFFVPLLGEHNVKNATAVLAALAQLGVPVDQAARALRSFKGIRRRLQVRFDEGGITVLDDFAHHPTEVRETLRALRHQYPKRRIWAAFEPRTATTKRKVSEQQYVESFDPADRVVFAPMHRPDKVPEAERLSLPAVLDGIRARGKSVALMPVGDEMANFISHQIEKGDVVLFMSNGDFGGTPGLLVKNLMSGFPVAASA